MTKVISIIVLIGLVISSIGCSEDRIIPTRAIESIDIQVRTEEWNSWPRVPNIINYYAYTISEGEEFFDGGTHQCEPDESLFKVLKIISEDKVEISFHERLVVVGEPINKPSAFSSVNVTQEGISLRTRSHDAGTDYTLKIVKYKSGDYK